MRRLAPLAALLLFAACEPKAEVAPLPAPAAEASAPGPFAGDFNAVGTEPFWAVEVREGTVRLSRPDAVDVTIAHNGPKVEGEKAVWAGPNLSLTLTPGECSDGMSDRVFGYVAEVKAGAETLKGCAAKAG